jgi:hypothetical protein
MHLLAFIYSFYTYRAGGRARCMLYEQYLADRVHGVGRSHGTMGSARHNSCLFSFYHYQQSLGVTCLLDTLKRNVQISVLVSLTP